ncbi:hypothetical protein F5I97DRAFT_1999997 [Phlebopus sp. FC_14]|nr:hypothetical protein F5I97DRAFT_1999997 [Phlebopus sp. FC_14]
MDAIAKKVESIRALLNLPPPYCSGTCPVPSDKFKLFYEVDSQNTSKIDLCKATAADLDKLAKACLPATFGRNKEDVYDESYRKALKLETTAFAAHFDAESAGLVDIIRQELLEGENDKREIMLELYKLNVYGKGSFFKPHKDTPRHERMFGSLVVVFPIAHEGGEFVLRHGDKEWVVDFAKMLARSPEPSVGYVAFYSDTEHEVFPVASGHRVTLTYNLYFKAEKAVTDVAAPLPLPYESSFADELASLISEPSFMPKGGYIGFGLRHEYPVSVGVNVDPLRTCLKGSDAAIARALNQLSLKWTLFVLVRNFYEGRYLSPCPLDLSEYSEHDDSSEPEDELSNCKLVRVIDFDGEALVDENGYYSTKGKEDLLEITEMPSKTSTEAQYAAYGNYVQLCHVYEHVVLVVDMGPKDDVEGCGP